MPKVCRTETVMSGRSSVSSDGVVVFTGITAFCRCSLSRGVAGLERRISLVDDFETLLGVLVAAVGVGVVLFDQRLVARLEIRQRHRLVQVEHRQRTRLGRCRMAMSPGGVTVGRRLVV